MPQGIAAGAGLPSLHTAYTRGVRGDGLLPRVSTKIAGYNTEILLVGDRIQPIFVPRGRVWTSPGCVSQ